MLIPPSGLRRICRPIERHSATAGLGARATRGFARFRRLQCHFALSRNRPPLRCSAQTRLTWLTLQPASLAVSAMLFPPLRSATSTLKSLASQAGVASPSRIIWFHRPEGIRACKRGSIPSARRNAMRSVNPTKFHRPRSVRSRSQPVKARLAYCRIDSQKPVEGLQLFRIEVRDKCSFGIGDRPGCERPDRRVRYSLIRNPLAFRDPQRSAE